MSSISKIVIPNQPEKSGNLSGKWKWMVECRQQSYEWLFMYFSLSKILKWSSKTCKDFYLESSEFIAIFWAAVFHPHFGHFPGSKISDYT